MNNADDIAAAVVISVSFFLLCVVNELKNNNRKVCSTDTGSCILN